MAKKKIGDLLVETGFITQEQLEQALEEQKREKKRLGDLFITKGYITEQQLIEVLEFQLGIPHVSLYKYHIDKSIAQTIPEQLAIRYQVIPINKHGNKLTVAMADPLDYYTIDDLRMTTGFQIEPVIATKEELTRTINRYYGIQETVKEIMQNLPKEDELEDEQIQYEDAPVSRMVNQIIKNGIQQRASDIHFDPQENELRVRFRVDGHLRTEQTLPKHMQGIITARLKIMSNLNIAEKRLPQDGRFKMDIEYSVVDVRVSSLPTAYGEKIVLRILDLGQAVKEITHLDFSEENEIKFRKMINGSYGMVLITGPTGSGKTSTLYAALNEINQEGVNIITVEDPIEYRLEGVNQVQVNEKTGLTFVTGLRSILRQDPNIIMVGEIRDLETAEIAVRSSLTGHIVLSTIHTNNAVLTITRLIDMGIEPYLVASSLSGIVAQRLVRRVCKDCAINYTPSVEEKQLLDQYGIEAKNLKIGKGCSKCNRTGFKGRLAIHEVLLLDDQVKKLVLNKESNAQYKEYLKESGFVTMLEDGLNKAAEGHTTVSEVIKATFSE